MSSLSRERSTMDKSSDTESVVDVEQSRGQPVRIVLNSSSASWAEVDSEVYSSDDDDSGEPEGSGELCDVKKLYEGQSKCTCCINWVEKLPDDVGPSAEEECESRRHALLVRLKRNYGGGKPMAVHSIVIQSPHLKSVLGQLFQGYSGITTTLKKLVFTAPFRCFFYEWHRLEQIIREIDDPVRKSHAQLLRKILRSELKETISQSNDLVDNGVITFDYLWTLFKPDTEVYTFDGGHDRILRLRDIKYLPLLAGAQVFEVAAVEIDYDGTAFGYNTQRFQIREFGGTRQIQDLNVFPASSHPRLGEIKVALRKRGELFRTIHLKPYYYTAYKGPVLDDGRRRTVDGRIVIDASSYSTSVGRWFKMIPFGSSSLKQGIDISEQTHQHIPQYHGRQIPGVSMSGCGSQFNVPPRGTGQMPHVTPGPIVSPMPLPLSGDKNRKWPELTDNLLHLCTADVRGYCFKIKKWVVFHIAHIREIQWQNDAFDSLVLAGEHKRLISAFVEGHAENKEIFDDVIEGKGQGITMLLEGPPGVGKTLTAEAVSEKLRRPLYAMGAGELGADAEAVEGSLTRMLDAAARWDAVVLLDECDVLLAERGFADGRGNLERNGVVAIFLRLLEYYRGMLFMTTNRADAVDPALRSRVHLTIRYPALGAAARRRIWERFVHAAASARPRQPQPQQQPSALGPDDLALLQELDLNGREIKNLVKTARLLASHEKAPLAMEHVRAVLSVSSTNAQLPDVGVPRDA
ncbi:P-loop containing nucleoside triphosphate hydrolase protein [Hypoxylon sp. FL1284]|nr:P-loop containing nucleoside triphosphate hydrolase protein [Hypoxylon sp. FL1284]